MFHRITSIAIGLSMGLGMSSLMAQPSVTMIHQDTVARSGRLSLAGTGFGSVRGEVRVAGVPALLSTWLDDRIVAYVAEGTPLGTGEVVVEVAAQTSAPLPVEVTARAPRGRIRWSVEIDSGGLYHRPAEAPDGTIYVHSFSLEGGGGGRVFAFSPQGALLWIREVAAWSYVPPIAGPDGAVYVGSLNQLTRISRSGQIEWTFSGTTRIAASAAIGPDGTVFAAFETGTTGLVALDPATGELLWSNADQIMNCEGCSNELRLGPVAAGAPADQIYLYWRSFWAFSTDGDLLWQGFSDIGAHEVGIGSDGTLYAPHGDELVAYSPFDGSFLWTANSPWLAWISDVEVGPSDRLYFVSDSRYIDGFDAQGRASLWHRDVGHYLARPSLSPDGATLLVSGGATCNDPAGCVISFVKAFSTSDGSELWHLDLDDVWDPEHRSLAEHHARISSDNTTAYFSGTILGNATAGDERGLLWAIALSDADLFRDSFETGDTSAWSRNGP